MNYPLWDVPYLGGSMVVAIIAILHVYISHFAIGGGLFLVLAEGKAYRENDPRILDYVRRNTVFFILLSLVLGAVTGVGIWFAIGLVGPAATSTLIHTFVWAWAIEWCFFLLEIASAIIYYYGWERLDRRTHIVVGWIYFISAWMSLFVINGILTFMLTPGRWIETHNVLDGFFNPAFLPSLLMRTAVAIALAGLYSLIAASLLRPEDLRRKMVQYSAKWLAPALILLPIGAVWFTFRMPEDARQIVMGGGPVVSILFGLSILFSLLLFIFVFVGAYSRPEWTTPPFAIMMFVIGFMATGTTEWVREAVRKPYIIYDYMYSNSVRTDDVPRLIRDGVLPSAKWSRVKQVSGANPDEAGHEIFRLQCASCHEIEGYNGVRPLVRTWKDSSYIDHQLAHLNTLKGYMPPFGGTAEERHTLAKWLSKLDDVE